MRAFALGALLVRAIAAQSCTAGDDESLWLLQRGARIEAARLVQEDGLNRPKDAVSLTQMANSHSSQSVDVPNVTVTFYKDSLCQDSDGTNASLPVDKDLCSLDWNFTCGCQNGKKVVHASTYFPGCENREETHTEVVQFDRCEDSTKFGSASGLFGKIVDDGTCPCCADDKQCIAYGEPHILGFDKADVSLFGKRGAATWHKRRKDARGQDIYLLKSPRLAVQARYAQLRRSGSQPLLRAVAIGGPALDGNRMIIEPLRGSIRWGRRNGRAKEVLTAEAPVLKILGLLSARVSNHTRDIEQPTDWAEGLHLQLPGGVQMVVNRRWKSLVAAITLDDSANVVKTDGHCGNFNGDPNDDTLSQIQARVGKRVPKRYIFFDQPHPND
mmetsp:Transcript_6325/g.15212  ORF Transcript_6325/g.15212 Transcript_6325/m.15212 type:complete len:385 (+) Transcript_6325:88-1242(+)